PPAVTVAQPLVQDVIDFLEYTGTTRAVEAVEVRARVEGFLESMHYEAGDEVEKNDLLFIIDPEPFELELKAASATVTSRKAELDLAQTEFERTRTLYKKQATSEIMYIKSRANRDTAAAALSLAEADLRSAELNLEYAHVRAPLSGRVGRHEVDIGNLVGSDGATVLTEIVVYSPLYVYFYISERDLFSLQQFSAERRERMGREWDERRPTPLYAGRAGEDGYPHSGIVNYTGLQIDPNTGTFEVRGLLPNLDNLDKTIIPGTFVRVQVPIGRNEGALLVPERALGADQSGRFLLVVNSKNIVEQRSVQVGPTRRDGTRVIEKGIASDDWVIFNGLQRARPGAEVTPTKEKMEPLPTPTPRPEPRWPADHRVDKSEDKSEESDPASTPEPAPGEATAPGSTDDEAAQ
ncbi:MAG: efflux RND transporter periplasmic adaptor subunit, partial [Deltaproteobacteria bacterium]|nr:efflux RND transporter periplasmic adaptor subunit [Deltaproteobacteria bacterium]